MESCGVRVHHRWCCTSLRWPYCRGDVMLQALSGKIPCRKVKSDAGVLVAIAQAHTTVLGAGLLLTDWVFGRPRGRRSVQDCG
ncbi:hypothetical protein FIBSPDRAFT_84120 [Athelia psychrophila]|uniref:Uncharacterized protein n=1 Tax=Athelia psychrophila TaxID=1759441 RepID=A0A166E4C4_9AGAM|nr:hypothetical protein FIBSPDRAFT_84120 [Fibularhizoctonia sp. CBS 109695]